MVTSNAAVVTLTAPLPVLQSDSLLTFLLHHLLPPLQINLSTPKKGSSISLTINEGTTTLTERNSILRALAGRTLLNRLDHHPYCLLGGYAEAVQSSPQAAMALASVGSYMSIASMIRSGSAKEQDVHRQLDEVLARNAFLVGATYKPSLADYDVFFALVEQGLGAENSEGMVHLRRWALAVQASIEAFVEGGNSLNGPGAFKNLPAFSAPALDFGVADPVPIFFYGEEGDDVTLAASAAASAASAAAAPSKPAAPATGGKGNQNTGGKKELTDEEKKAAAEKRAKKNAEKAAKKAKGGDGGKNNKKGGDGGAATELNVTALDIRIGKIIEVWEHESSDKLWCEKIDFGEGEPRQVLSGLRAFYKKEEMEGKTVMVLCNLKKRNLAGVPSHGMVLCATNADHTAVEFVVPPEGAKIGERVNFEGLTGDPEPENKIAKKKILEKLAPDLKTNGEGIVVWKGIKSVTSAGPCVASKGMKDAQVS